MRDVIRVGIVGGGLMGQVHSNIYQKLGAKVAWVYDVVREKAEKIAGAYGARVAESVEAMADTGLIDAASVCSPPACHAVNCLPLIEAGIPVLCEKPLAAGVADAEIIRAAVARKGAVFMTGFTHRFFSPTVRIAQLVHEGKLGKAMMFRNIFGQYSEMKGNSNADPALAGGGVLTGNGSHSIDLCRYLVGEPTAVQAMGGTLMQDIGVEDWGLLHIAVGKEAFAEIAASFSLHFGQYDLEWYGTGGVAVVKYFGPKVPTLRYRVVGDADWTTEECAVSPDIFAAELGQFLACVRGEARPAVTVEDGVKVCRILEGVYRSMREGRRVGV